MLFCKVHFSKSRAKVQNNFYIRKRARFYCLFPSIFTQNAPTLFRAGALLRLLIVNKFYLCLLLNNNLYLEEMRLVLIK